MPVVQLSNLFVHVNSSGCHTPIIHDVSFTLETGEVLLLIGANGAGKSTIMYSICGVIPHALETYKVEGKISIQNKDVLAKGFSPSNEQICFITQNPESQFLGLNVSQEIDLCLSHITDLEMFVEIKKNLIKEIGLEKHMLYPTTELSMGQKQKLVLSTAFLKQPKVVLLDEPTSFLDESMIKWLLQKLQTEKEKGVVIIISTHNVALFNELATKVLAIKKGRIFFNNDISEITNDKLLELYEIEDKTVTIV